MKRLTLLFTALSSLLFSNSSYIFKPGQVEKDQTSNEQVVHAFFKAFEQNSEKELSNTLASHYTVNSIADIHQLASKRYSAGSNDLKARMRAYHKAFPNLDVVVKELISSGDTVVAKVSFNGMQKGPFFGVAPTNRYLTFFMVAIFRLEDGKIFEVEEMTSDYSLMRQMGYFIL